MEEFKMKMDRLFFNLQNDKHFYRQAHILLYLDTHKTVVRTINLVQEVGCSLPTLYTDIEILNSVLPEGVFIEHHQHYGYELKCTVDISIFSFIMEMGRKSIVFQLIDNLFHNQTYSFYETAEKLFVCESTLRKIIKHLNMVLRDFNIRISTSIVDFIGDETDIRNFLFAFYSDFRDCFSENDFSNEKTEPYVSPLNIRSSELHLSYYRLTVWTMIIKERTAHKHHVLIKKSVKEEVIKRESFKSFYNILYQEFENFGFTMDEIVWCYIVTLNCVSYSHQDLLFSQRNNKTPIYCYEEKREIVEKINKFLSLVLPPEIVRSPKADKIRAYLINLRLLSQLSHLFEKPSMTISNYAKKSNEKIFKKYKRVLEKHGAELLFPIHYFDEIAGSLSLFHAPLVESYKKKEDISIIIAFQGELGYDELIIRTAKSLVPDDARITYVFDDLVTTDMIKKTGASLVVCNYNLVNIESAICKTFHLSTYPDALELKNLRHVIAELVTPKVVI